MSLLDLIEGAQPEIDSKIKRILRRSDRFVSRTDEVIQGRKLEEALARYHKIAIDEHDMLFKSYKKITDEMIKYSKQYAKEHEEKETLPVVLPFDVLNRLAQYEWQEKKGRRVKEKTKKAEKRRKESVQKMQEISKDLTNPERIMYFTTIQLAMVHTEAIKKPTREELEMPLELMTYKGKKDHTDINWVTWRLNRMARYFGKEGFKDVTYHSF